MSDRDRILASIAEPEGGPYPAGLRAATFQSESNDLWRIFQKRLEDQGGNLVSESALDKLIGQRCWFDEDALMLLSGPPWVIASTVWEASVGITTADCAIAETGSTLLSAGPGRHRLASLAPPLHVALVRKDHIVRTLDEGLSRLSDRTSVLITGPSRTADIEGVLVRGVHGPRELWVVPV